MKTKGLILVVVIVIILLTIFFVFRNKESNITRDKDVIRIGALLSLTGSGAEFGSEQKNAIELFKEEKGNYKKEYEFILQDTKSNPKDGVSALQNLLSKGKIDVVMTVLSGVSLATLPITEKQKIPTFCVGSTPSITSDFKFAFRSLPTADYQASQLAKHFLRKFKIKSISIIYLNDDFGVSSKDNFQNFIKDSVKNISSYPIMPDEINFPTIISKAINNKPDAVYIACYGNSIANVLKELKQQNFKGLICSTLEVSYPEVLELAKESANGVYFVDTEIAQSNGNRFFDRYYKKYNKKPSLDAVLAYDEIQVIVNTIETDGLKDFLKIKGDKTIRKSANGEFTINQKGDFEYSLFFKVIKNNTPILIQ
jgi:branched-chain amino acid transport system substrate-binding protein